MTNKELEQLNRVTKRINSLSRISESCMNILSMTNKLANNQIKIIDKLKFELVEIEKKNPKYFYNIDYIKKFRKYMRCFKRLEYYTKISDRELYNAKKYVDMIQTRRLEQ